jgi:CHAT domain-containing protein
VITTESLTSMLLQPNASWKALGLGVTKAHGTFPALPGVQRELEAVVRERDTEPGLLPGRRSLDERFTRDILSDLGGKWPVVHIASHFSFNTDAQTESFLLLGDGTHLTLGDLQRQQDPFTGVELLVLSACETGVIGGRGAEVDGLATLAESKGASAVVATMWRTWDGSTPTLMRRFYQVRETGSPAAGPCARAGATPVTAGHASKAEALRVAQCEMAKGQLDPKALPASQRKGATHPESNPTFPEWTHPYYWAPFVLLGNAN